MADGINMGKFPNMMADLINALDVADKAFVQVATAVNMTRNIIASMDENGILRDRIVVRIEFTGSVHRGELACEVAVGESYIGDSAVRGMKFRAVMTEFLRRKNFESDNKPLMLSFVPEKE